MLIKNKNDIIFESVNMTENVVLRELNKLPQSYFIFNDVCLRLLRPVKYRKTEEYVKSCQIDFVVIGPTGIFIIGVKERSENLLKEVDVAGLIFYIRTVNSFHRKFPIYNVAVMITKTPRVQYEYVHHLTLRQLYWFIRRREGSLTKRKVRKITRWLTKTSNSKYLLRKIL